MACATARTRYRRRYVDLIANPEVREIFRTVRPSLRALREYFDGEDFLEVETPILQPIYGGAAAKPLSPITTNCTRTSTCASPLSFISSG